MAKQPDWTEEEKNLLRQHYPVAANCAMLDLLPGRSLTGIRHMASKLDVVRPVKNRVLNGHEIGTGGGYFSDQEDAMLRELYPTIARVELLVAFPLRTWESLYSRGRHLGLRRDDIAAPIRYPDAPLTAHMAEYERAYLAGIIDGEGCLYLRRRNATARRSSVIRYELTISVTNTHRGLIDWINGHIPAYIGTRHPSRGNYVQYSWCLTGNKRARRLCRELSPYMIVKRDQAELMANGWDDRSNEECARICGRMHELKRNAG